MRDFLGTVSSDLTVAKTLSLDALAFELRCLWLGGEVEGGERSSVGA